MTGPLLSDEQALAYQRDAVLSRTGLAGNERFDPWTPWTEDGDPHADVVVAPDDLQAAVDRILHEGGRTGGIYN